MKEILLGDSIGAFIGEVPNAGFVTYTQLASLSGITPGSVTNEGSGFLAFNYLGKHLIIAKKNTRTNISWDQLNAVGCVFGTKQVTINGKKYKVRLLTGANQNPVPNYGTPGLFNYYLPSTHNSEWSKLFYPLVRDDSNLPSPPGNPFAIYTKADLDMAGPTSYSWTQETAGNDATLRMNRGFDGPSSAYHFIKTHNTSNIDNWRPCLELVTV